MTIENRLNKVIKIIVYLIYGILVHLIIDWTQKKSSEIIGQAFVAMSVDPPLLTNWIYRDTLFMLLGFGIILFLSLGYAIALPIRFQLMNGFIENTLLTIYTVFFILNIKIQKNFYLPQKKWMILIFISILFFLFIQYKNYFKKFFHILFSSTFILEYIIPIFSLIQIFIAVYLDPLSLPEGDDPHYYYHTAIGILNNQKFESFPLSPGMTYFIAFIFFLFGDNIYYPKIFLGILNALGLFFLIQWTLKYLHSKRIAWIVGIFYLSNSHFVSFSIMFWNENLFHPFLSIFIFLFSYINKGKLMQFGRFILFFLLLILSNFMVILRSWFPLFLIAYSFMKIYELRKKKELLLPVILFIIIFPLSYIFVKNYVLNSKGIFLTSNFKNNFVIGNNPYSQGTYSRHWLHYTQETGFSIDSDEIFYQVIRDNFSNPYLIIKNLSKKFILWFFGVGGPRPHSSYYQNPLSIPQAFYRITSSIFLFIGFLYLLKKKHFLIPVSYFSIFIVHMVFFADYRFTLTAMPLQAILVGYGILVFLFWLKNKENLSS